MQKDDKLPGAAEQAPLPRFCGQWNGGSRWPAQEFTKPSCTVPDQSMTIPEIIAKYTRTGLVPQSFAKRDEGGNAAFEPGFDPLDEYSELQASRAAQTAAPGSSGAAPAAAPEEPQSPAPAPAGA